MSSHPADDRQFDSLRPEDLAAYVDGELNANERAAVEAWLARDPQALIEMVTQSRLHRLWQATRAEAPCEAQWNTCYGRIRAGIRARQNRARHRRWMAVLGSVAATLLIIAVPWRPSASSGDGVIVLDSPVPYPVLLPEEVEITSLDPADSSALVVGEAPVSGPIVPAAAGEVLVQSVQPDPAGMLPRVYAPSHRSAVPMVVGSIGVEPIADALAP